MAVLCVARDFTALHGTRSVKRDGFRAEVRLSGNISKGFVSGLDHATLQKALGETVARLEGSYLDDVVGRATNENIALYIMHSLAGLPVGSVLVREGQGQSVEVSSSDLDSSAYPAYLYLSRAQSLLLRDKILEATAAAEAAIRLDPAVAEAHNLMGRCQKYLGHNDLAAESYARAVVLQPNFGDAYRNLGNAYLELGRYSEMAEAFARATELTPGSALAFNNRGFGYQKLGDLRRALECHSKAIELDPHYAEAYEDRSKVHEALGNAEMARQDVATAKELISSGTDTYSPITPYYDGNAMPRYVPPDLYYGIAVYNEEGNIRRCLDSLERQSFEGRVETIICLNGCTDRSEKEAHEGKAKYPGLNVKIIHSKKKGKAFAQNQIIRSIRDRTVPIAFIDADVVPETDCMAVLERELRSLKQLVAVGTWPEPERGPRQSLWQRFLYWILYARAFYPQAEVSGHDVSAYKRFARQNPQPLVSPEFEMRSKIFFHGRTFMLRNASFFRLPEDANVADDTYLPNFIHTTYGPGTVRIRYDAKVLYKPYLSLRAHFKAYWRVYSDLRRMDLEGAFAESRKLEKTRLDWKFIFSKGIATSLQFAIYRFVVGVERALYHMLPEKKLGELWYYQKK